MVSPPFLNPTFPCFLVALSDPFRKFMRQERLAQSAIGAYRADRKQAAPVRRGRVHPAPRHVQSVEGVHLLLERPGQPPTVAIFMRGQLWNIAYAKPGDERWALVDDKGWRTFPNNRRVISISDGQLLRCVWYLSAVTLRGRIYLVGTRG